MDQAAVGLCVQVDQFPIVAMLPGRKVQSAKEKVDHLFIGSEGVIKQH